MIASSTAMPCKPTINHVLKTIAWVGLLVGTLDITCACIQAYLAKGISPVIVLQYIASGFFGKAAFAGGAAMAFYGLLFHYCIAYAFTALFFVIYPNVKLLTGNYFMVAVGYSLFMYVVTTFIIIPLSHIGKINFRLEKALLAIGILVIAIGLPLAFFARRFYYGNKHR